MIVARPRGVGVRVCGVDGRMGVAVRDMRDGAIWRCVAVGY